MNPAIEQFVSGGSVSERAKLLTEMIRLKVLHEVSKTQEFSTALDELAKSAGDKHNPERQLSLSILCKVAGLVRDLRAELASKIAKAIETEVAGPITLIDPDDRYYLASFWRYSTASWVPTLLANWMAEEESAEKARRECAAGLVSIANSYSDSIGLLSRALARLQIQTKSPADSIGKRFKRCVTAAHEAISVSKNDEPGKELGKALCDLVRNTFAQSGLPKSEAVIRDAAEAMLKLLVVVVRKRIGTALDGDLYSVVLSLRDWFGASQWAEFTEGDLAQTVASDVADSLEIAVRSGRADRQLLSVLSLISGTEGRALARLNRIIESNLGLSDELIAWLKGKPTSRSTALSEQSQLAQMDAALAELVLNSDAAAHLRSEIEGNLLPGLAIFPSISDRALRRLLEVVTESRLLIGALSSQRGLETFGEVGSEVRFSPLEHEFEDPRELGSRVVKIVRCGVLASTLDGRRRVVRKAVVRRTEGDGLG